MKNKIVLGVLLLVVVAIAAALILKNNQAGNADDNNNQTALEDPIDLVSPFVNEWFDAVVATTTDPYQAGLATDSRLTSTVHEYLASKQTAEGALDPVLCQQTLPPRVGVKAVFKVENKAQFMVLPRGLDNPVPERTLIDLEVRDGQWKITKIECISGESAPVSEFSFDRTGFLLKADQAPLDPNTWYLVFEENGVKGHTAPLFFSEVSTCVGKDGAEAVCDLNQFVNPSEAVVKGEMTEAGVDVERVEFVN